MRRLIFFLLAVSFLCYAYFSAGHYLYLEASGIRERDVDVNISQVYPQPEIPIWIHDTDRFNFTITDDGTNAYDLTGKDVYFAGKKYLSDTNFIFLIECDVDDATGGLCHADFLPTSIPTAGVYQAGIRITQSTNVIVTAWIGKLKARGVIDDGQTGWTPPEPWTNYVTFSQGDARYGQKIPGHSNLWQSGFDDFRGSDVRIAEPTETNQPATKKYVDNSVAEYFPYTDDAYIIVKRGNNDIENGTALKFAYTAAKALTPGGNALAATNRACLIIPAGRYDLGSVAWDIDADFVDVRGEGKCRWNDLDGDDLVEANEITFPDTHIICDTDTEVILVIARDVHIRGLHVDHEDNTRALIINEANGCDRSQFINIGANSIIGVAGGLLDPGVLNGYWQYIYSTSNVIYGSGSGITVCGIFVNCAGKGICFGGGVGGVASGIFIDCVGIGNSSFGGCGGSARGLFIRCVGGETSFSAMENATFIECTGGDGSFTVSSLSGATNVIMRRCISTGRSTGIGEFEAGDNPYQGLMEDCYIEAVGENINAVVVATPAKLFGNTLIATGTGKSIYAASPQTITLGQNDMNNGISTNITVILYDDSKYHFYDGDGSDETVHSALANRYTKAEADTLLGGKADTNRVDALEAQTNVWNTVTQKVTKTSRNVPIPLSYFVESTAGSGANNSCQVSFEASANEQVEIQGRSYDTSDLRTAYVYSIPMTIGEYPLMPNFTSWQANAFTYTIRTDSTNVTDNLINIAICQKKDALYQTGFNTTDTPPFSAGPLDGQNGWAGSGNVNVQTAILYEGDQSVQVLTNACATRSISVGSFNKRCVNLYVRPTVGGVPPSPGADATSLLYFSSSGIMCANGDHSGCVSSWENTGVVPTGTQWYEITIIEDFNAHTWECWIDGTLTLIDLGLINNNPIQNHLDIYGTCCFDAFSVLDSHPLLVTNLVSTTAGVNLTGNIGTNDVINALGDGDTFWWKIDLKSKEKNSVYFLELKANYEE